MLEGVVATVLNSVLSAYVDNLNTDQLNVGIWSGDVKLRGLKLKKSALDKFHLPIDVQEGFLGELTLSIPWSNLKGKPVRVLIDNVFVLARPRSASVDVDDTEEDDRIQAVKQSKLASAELIGRDQMGNDTKQESFTQSLTTKILDNLQITVRNIHVRYEDSLSNPVHPFSAGITLSEFSAVSTDENWKPTFVQHSANGIHKVARLDSLSIYWDTDSEFIAPLKKEDASKPISYDSFQQLIPRADHLPSHQFILKPVSGVGRLIMRNTLTNEIPKMDVQLLFENLGFALDDEQYRDIISVVDLFHYYTRQALYRRFRPTPAEFEANPPKAQFQFAIRAVLDEVHQRRYRWTWDYFKQRRDDRKAYVRLFKAKAQLTPDQVQVVAGQSNEVVQQLDALERKLDYKDIRFYRSIARREMRREQEQAAAQGREVEQQKLDAQPQQQGWLGWLWGGGSQNSQSQRTAETTLQLNDEQRKELYDAIDWDDSTPNQDMLLLDLPRDAIKLHVTTMLQRGSFTLRAQEERSDVISVIFSGLQGELTQRVDNLDLAISLGDMKIIDGTTPNTAYPEIVRVKGEDLLEVANESEEEIKPPTKLEIGSLISHQQPSVAKADPFFFVKYEHKPLDERADHGVTLRVGSTEIVYHRGYVEAVTAFFEPPESELELIGALIDAASDTIEGIRKQTRAGLENALDNHKTIDMNVDVKAPIIIFPEDVTARQGQHMVLDAGRISVSSVFADKQALADVRAKQNQQYTAEDYRRLEDLMYDRFIVKLDDAQLLLGADIDACLRSLVSPETDGSIPDISKTHFIERINLNFTLHNCILPKAPNLTKFKITGHLPALQVNFSDRKYKTLMQLISLIMPRSKDKGTSPTPSPSVPQTVDPAEQRGAGRYSIFGAPRGTDEDYLVEQDDDNDNQDDGDDGDDDFKDVEDDMPDRVNADQKSFELSFRVDRLLGRIARSDPDLALPDTLLVNAVFEGFHVGVSVYPYNLSVDVRLRSVDLEDKIIPHPHGMFRWLMTSQLLGDQEAVQATDTKDLVAVTYNSVDVAHPAFQTEFEGIDQSVDIKLSTLNFMITRESILTFNQWIMNTFTSAGDVQPSGKEEPAAKPASPVPSSPSSVTERASKMRVRVKLNGVIARLNHEGDLLATIAFSTADVAVLMRGATMRVAARLGSLSLVDNQLRNYGQPEFAKVLAIEGDELADFAYETFDPKDVDVYPGYDSFVWLRTGSLRFTVLEEPLQDLTSFFRQFAEMKTSLDAEQAAVQQGPAPSSIAAQTAQLQEASSKMHYDVIIKTPIVVLPRASDKKDVVVANLGEIYAHNAFFGADGQPHKKMAKPGEGLITRITAGVRHVRLASQVYHDERECRLQIIKDVNLAIDVVQNQNIESEDEEDQPNTQVRANLSDVSLRLTEEQFCFLIDLSRSIPRAFAQTDQSAEGRPSTGNSKTDVAARRSSGPATSPARPAATIEDGDRSNSLKRSEKSAQLANTTLDLLFSAHAIQLEIFDGAPKSQDAMPNASLARFALNGTELKLRSMSDQSMEAELALKSFTVRDTRVYKETKFREIVPAVKHDGHQFMLSYSAFSGGGGLLVTIDSPKVIFALDPMFALLNFWSSPFSNQGDRDFVPNASSSARVERALTPPPPAKPAEEEVPGVVEPSFAYRVNLVAPTFILLANPEKTNSEAIVLSIKQVLISQQVVLALTVDQFGMFMCRMTQPKDTTRLLDNFNMTLSMDSGSREAKQVTSIDVQVDPLVLRIALRDVRLISSVVNEAIKLSNQSPDKDKAPSGAQDASEIQRPSIEDAYGSRRGSDESAVSQAVSKRNSTSTNDSDELVAPHLLVSKEVLNVAFSGLQVVVIGDLHGLPVLDLNVSETTVNAQDWSSDLRVSAPVQLRINFYNLSRSHWEPLIDPWRLEFGITSDVIGADKNVSKTISSDRRLEVNVSSTFIDTISLAVGVYSDEHQRVEASRNAAPFKIVNRTGYRISVWPEHHDKRVKPNATHLADGASIPWRFDDWKTMRESTTAQHDNLLSLHIDSMPWERVKHISVDREGVSVLNLRPKLDKVGHQLAYEVRLQDNVKIITFRSTFNIENLTLVPVEMMIVDEHGNPNSEPYKMAPSETCPVPIEAAYYNQIRIRPDPGFEYKWSEDVVGWRDLVSKSSRVMACISEDEGEAPFRFQCYTLYNRQDPRSRIYPHLSLKLRAPVEIENLLPYDVQYRIFDKNLNQNWSSYLRKGGISPIHVVELSHLLLLSIDIQSPVFSPSDFAIISTDNPDDFPVEKTLTLTDIDGLKLQLRMHFVHQPESGGAFKVQMYSPYIFINQTGQPFQLKSKSWMGVSRLVAGQQEGSTQSLKPDPFLFSQPSNDRRNRMLLKVGDSQWSRPLTFEAVGSQTEVVIPSSRKNEEYYAGLAIEDGLGKFKLSKVVKLMPRFLISNHLGVPINLREAGAADFIHIQPKQRAPLQCLRVGATKQITLAYPGLNNKWTAPCSIEDIGSVFLRIARAGEHQHLIKVDVLLEGPTIFISLRLEDGPWPAVMRNESDYTVVFAQASEARTSSGEVMHDEVVGARYVLQPRSKMKYAWDYPALSDKVIKLMVGDRDRNVNVMEIGALVPWRIPGHEGRHSGAISLDVRADGPTQTLVLSNYSEDTSNYKLTRQMSALSRTDSLGSVRDPGFESVDVDTKILSSFNIELEGIGISLINRNAQEMAYMSFRGLELHHTESEVTIALNLTCKWIQIDNQLFGGLFPIVLYPSVIPKVGKDLEVHPTLQMSAIKMKGESHGVTHIKYASVLMQELTIELDEDFLYALYEFFKFTTRKADADDTDFIENPTTIPEPQTLLHSSDDVYYEILHLQPVALNLSFMRTERVNADDRVSSRNPMIFFINALTMALGNVNEAPVRLNALVIENVRLSRAVLSERIRYHYTQEFLYQLYRVLGSADFLGNPVGLFNNVSSGVADMFYEPYQGLVMHGNKELGLGIARGASSFVKKTVFGVSDSMSKVTGSIGKGLAAATMDKEFQDRRRMTRFRNKPKHALYGFATGANSFLTSVASGFEGLALRPLEGAEQGGAGGFLRGMGKGLVGAITKPAVGVFDLASNFTEGVRNTTQVFDQNAIDRVRLPRYVAADGIVRPYNERDALGQMWLKNADHGTLLKEQYVAWIDVGGHEGDAAIILTTNRIVYIQTIELRVAWDVPLSELSSISLEDKGISLLLRTGHREGPYLTIPEASTRAWFFKKLSVVVQDYNARKFNANY